MQQQQQQQQQTHRLGELVRWGPLLLFTESLNCRCRSSLLSSLHADSQQQTKRQGSPFYRYIAKRSSSSSSSSNTAAAAASHQRNLVHVNKASRQQINWRCIDRRAYIYIYMHIHTSLCLFVCAICYLNAQSFFFIFSFRSVCFVNYFAWYLVVSFIIYLFVVLFVVSSICFSGLTPPRCATRGAGLLHTTRQA